MPFRAYQQGNEHAAYAAQQRLQQEYQQALVAGRRQQAPDVGQLPLHVDQVEQARQQIQILEQMQQEDNDIMAQLVREHHENQFRLEQLNEMNRRIERRLRR